MWYRGYYICRTFLFVERKFEFMPAPNRNKLYEATIRRMVDQALEAEENSFTQAHDTDTDEELLMYLRQCADELGHSPCRKEIAGWLLIETRFGTWLDALQKAGLPPCSSSRECLKYQRVQLEVAHQKDVYRKKKAEKKRRTEQRGQTRKD